MSRKLHDGNLNEPSSLWSRALTRFYRSLQPPLPPALPPVSPGAAEDPPSLSVAGDFPHRAGSVPGLDLSTLAWLEEALRPESTLDPDPEQVRAHRVFHQALVRKASSISIHEEEEDELPASPDAVERLLEA